MLDALARDPTRQRRRWMLGAGAVGLVGAGLWGAAQSGNAAPPPPPCTGIEAEIAEQWNPKRRDRVAAAFAATEKAGAEDDWTRVVPRIDAYAETWTSLRHDTCLAAADGDRTQLNEMRIMCLDQRANVLEKLLQTLEDPDDELVAKVQDVVGQLPRISSCDDATYLTAEVKPPGDPALAEQAAALRQRLDDTLPLQWRGEYDQALVALRSIADDADAIDYLPLAAQLRFRLGVTLDYQGDYDAARETLETCFFDAQVVGSRLLAARCATKLVHVVSDHLGEHAAALTWARHAQAAIEGGDLDDQIRGSLRNNRGNVLLNLDRDEEALEAYQAALELWTRELGLDDVDLAVPLGNIARVHLKRNEYDAAIEAAERALSLRIRHAGEDHPQVADDRVYLARTYRKGGRVDDAVAQLRLALAGLEARLGPEHRQTIDARAELGRTLTLTDAKTEGVGLLRRALAAAPAGEGSLHVTQDQIRAWLAEATRDAPAQAG